jgi:hypothetical protein
MDGHGRNGDRPMDPDPEPERLLKRSDTVDGCEILHQLIDGRHPIIYRVSTIQGGAGFFSIHSM